MTRLAALAFVALLLVGCRPSTDDIRGRVERELTAHARFAGVKVEAGPLRGRSLTISGTVPTENDKFDAFRDAWLIVNRIQGDRRTIAGIWNEMVSDEYMVDVMRRLDRQATQGAVITSPERFPTGTASITNAPCTRDGKACHPIPVDAGPTGAASLRETLFPPRRAPGTAP